MATVDVQECRVLLCVTTAGHGEWRFSFNDELDARAYYRKLAARGHRIVSAYLLLPGSTRRNVIL